MGVFLLFLGLAMAALPDFVAGELMTFAAGLQRFKQHLDGTARFLPEPELRPVSERARIALRCCGIAVAVLGIAGLAGLGR